MAVGCFACSHAAPFQAESGRQGWNPPDAERRRQFDRLPLVGECACARQDSSVAARASMRGQARAPSHHTRHVGRDAPRRWFAVRVFQWRQWCALVAAAAGHSRHGRFLDPTRLRAAGDRERSPGSEEIEISWDHAAVVLHQALALLPPDAPRKWLEPMARCIAIRGQWCPEPVGARGFHGRFASMGQPCGVCLRSVMLRARTGHGCFRRVPPCNANRSASARVFGSP